MSNRHIIKTGPNAGKWDKCTAQVKCQNGGLHAEDAELRAAREVVAARAGVDVKQVPLKSLTQKEFLTAQKDPSYGDKLLSARLYPSEQTQETGFQAFMDHLRPQPTFRAAVDVPGRDKPKMVRKPLANPTERRQKMDQLGSYGSAAEAEQKWFQIAPQAGPLGDNIQQIIPFNEVDHSTGLRHVRQDVIAVDETGKARRFSVNSATTRADDASIAFAKRHTPYL